MIEKIYFELEDKVELVGLLHTPQVKTDEIVISIHGMQSNCFKKREDILAKNINNADIAYFAFNNRGTELMCYTKKTDGRKELNGGSVYEDVLESYYDIKGAIDKAVELGYKKIHLQGHSLGCTKIIYTYNRMKNENYEMLNYIKSIILLSLVDIVDCQKYDLGMDKYNEMLNWAESKEQEGKQMDLMPNGAFDHPISVKSYLRYFRDNKDIDFAKFSEKDYDFKELNNIKSPLFIRWGEKDLVIQKLTDLIEFLKTKITNAQLDISYIEKTDHGYTNKEKELAEEIIKFIKNN
ncbi:MAG: DUF1749 domain-containing protein [Clostridiales bacterium]|nr:DUF1749 domain-containing protein [Clostridiales bacterium]